MFFAECGTGRTRQRPNQLAPPSASNGSMTVGCGLSYVVSRTLGKVFFKNTESVCRVQKTGARERLTPGLPTSAFPNDRFAKSFIQFGLVDKEL